MKITLLKRKSLNNSNYIDNRKTTPTLLMMYLIQFYNFFKKVKNTILALLIVLSVSCKEKEKQINSDENILKTKTINIKEKKDDILKILIDIRVQENDKFEVYYVNDSPDGVYEINNKTSTYVKGSYDFQIVRIVLPEGVLPYKFRIDLGDNINKHETNVEIRSIKIELNGKIIEIDNSLIDRFFQPNLFLQKTTNGYSRKVVNGRYDPFLIATPLLIKKMEIEL